MKIRLLLISISLIFMGCARPLYIKDRHFDCGEHDYSMDTDLKELVYKSIEKAFVADRDIADYIYLWKKHRIYVAKEYQKLETNFNTNQKKDNLSYLDQSDLPTFIRSVRFCLKSQEELQKISNKTREDFLHISFDVIKIDGDNATVGINNTWITSKHSKVLHLGGGGYTLMYKKIDGEWRFYEIASSWIS